MAAGLLRRKIRLLSRRKRTGRMTPPGILMMLFLVGIPVMKASAEEDVYPIIYGEEPGGGETVMELDEAEGEYTVLPGESLWRIAEKLWGDGRRYMEIFDANREELADPNVIYPGMILRIAQRGFIVKEKSGREGVSGGIQMEGYSVDMPEGWRVGTLSSGDAFANFALSGDGIRSVACLIQDRKQESLQGAEEWQAYEEKIRSYVQENYSDSVSELAFEHYQMENNEEVYLYSYLWQLDLEKYQMEGSFDCRVSVGIKLTEHAQAEFVGFATKYDIQGCVRYVTASFEEKPEAFELASFSLDDSNMAISPQTRWELEEMFNPFPWIEEFFTSMLDEAVGIEEEKQDPRQALIDRTGRRVSEWQKPRR